MQQSDLEFSRCLSIRARLFSKAIARLAYTSLTISPSLSNSTLRDECCFCLVAHCKSTIRTLSKSSLRKSLSELPLNTRSGSSFMCSKRTIACNGNGYPFGDDSEATYNKTRFRRNQPIRTILLLPIYIQYASSKIRSYKMRP